MWGTRRWQLERAARDLVPSLEPGEHLELLVVGYAGGHPFLFALPALAVVFALTLGGPRAIVIVPVVNAVLITAILLVMRPAWLARTNLRLLTCRASLWGHLRDIVRSDPSGAVRIDSAQRSFLMTALRIHYADETTMRLLVPWQYRREANLIGSELISSLAPPMPLPPPPLPAPP